MKLSRLTHQSVSTAFKLLLLPMVSSGMDRKLSVMVSQAPLEGHLSLHINDPELLNYHLVMKIMKANLELLI